MEIDLARTKQKTFSAKILIVDDDQDTLEAVSQGLDIPMFYLTVLTAKDGREGLEIAREAKPSLILVDLAMPKLNGFEMITELKKEPSFKNTRIIMLTADNNRTKLWESIDLEFDDFITKPFNLFDLESRIYYQLIRE